MISIFSLSNTGSITGSRNDIVAAPELIPEYAFIDSVLAILTLVHISVAITFVTVSDASYKKPLVKLHYSLAKKFHDIPLLVPTLTLCLTIMTVQLLYLAYHNSHNPDLTLRAVICTYTWVSSLFLQKLSTGLVKLGVEKAMLAEQAIEQHDIANWTPPPHWTAFVFAPLQWLLRPQVHGAENIRKDIPGLYVTNHSLFGIEMAPFVLTTYKLKGVFLRGLSDHMHFGHLHGEFIRFFGGVDGTRKNVDCLMENKHNVLVYPGGCHEICKPSTVPKYQLMWKERLGFVRMAIKHGYDIVPCCSVGTEEMMDIMFDIPADFFRKDLKLPVIAPVMPHRIQRVYFWYGEPIPTSHYKGDYNNDEIAREVRDMVKASVEAGIRKMQQVQANDPDRYLVNYIANSTMAALSSMIEFCKDPYAATCSSSSLRATKSLDYDEPVTEQVPASRQVEVD